ncbi:MAG: hypothetical protein ACYTGM_19140 [Planctomycetota bacterium]
MWKWVVIVVVIIVVAAAVYASTTVSQLVDTAPARRGTVSAFVEERATTRLPRTYRITMPIDGRILPIELESGDPVRAGEIVAQVELADLDTAVQMAEARVRRLQARIVENNDTRIELSTIRELDSVLESVDRSVEARRRRARPARRTGSRITSARRTPLPTTPRPARSSTRPSSPRSRAASTSAPTFWPCGPWRRFARRRRSGRSRSRR